MPRFRRRRHRYDADANGTLDVDEFSVIVHQLDTVALSAYRDTPSCTYP